MVELGDLVYFSCITDSGSQPVCGWIVEAGETDVVIGTTPKSVEGAEHTAEGVHDSVRVGFVRVGIDSLKLERPVDWKGPKPRSIPSFEISAASWKAAAGQDLPSSGAENPRKTRQKAETSRSKSRLDFRNLQRLYEEDTDSEEEEESLEAARGRPRGSGYLPPGQSSAREKRSGDKPQGSTEAAKETDLNAAVRKQLQRRLAQGDDGQDLMPMMMMAMLLKDEKKKKARGSKDAPDELLGGSSSDDSEPDDLRGRGMKAVSTLQKLHRRIHTHPKRIVELFEKEVIEELGVVQGQAWTLKDYIRKQNFGKYKGLFRCTMMDVSVYELLRAGETDIALAQVTQNIKAKLQSVISQGDWSTAWLLTGLQDPLQRREFAGSKEEMTVISGYIEALAKLKKRVRETQGGADPEEDEGPGPAGRK